MPPIKYPIKYIDNNMVWNHDGEVFAYYELIPYNYSFLSADEKMQIHDSFCRLIAQNREGKIHALQLSAESSLTAAQEQSKKLAKGQLKELAVQRVEDQTEALAEVIKDTLIDYRFFIGFKLIPAADEFSLKNYAKDFVSAFQDFLNEVNHTLMGDFIKISNFELERFFKIENLLESDLSRKFRIRKLNKDDIGYIIEHVYGLQGVPYDEYEYILPKKKLKRETEIKRYDLLKPARCLVEENQKYIKFERENETIYAAYFTIHSIIGELDFPSSEIFYYQQAQFSFPVDTSLNVEIVPNQKALRTVRGKKKELKDLDNHAYESNNDTANNVIEALDSVDELESNLDKTRENLYKLSYVVRVTAKNPEELKLRCTHVQNFYESQRVKLVRPFGDQLGLHSEFIPSSKRYINDYVQYVTSDFLAGLGFGATQMLGDNSGFYIGFNLDTDRSVYLNPSLACQGVKGSVTNALAASFTGSLGGGKSLLNNLIVLYSVLFGGRAVIVDPKSERAKWVKHLPELAEHINVINLTNDDSNKGLLDPYTLMSNPKDAESLALDILTFLTGISARDGEKFPVLREAVRKVTNSERKGLLQVIRVLQEEDTEISNKVAKHIDSFRDCDFAQLLFGDGSTTNKISMDKPLNIIQVADLVLPDSTTKFEEYTTVEMLSVALLIAISTFSLDFIHSDRSTFKIVDLDEAWSFLQVAQGKTLSNKLVRAGRAMQAAVYFVTPNVDDVSDERIKNNIGLKFAFRSTDMNEIKKTLRYFGVDENDEYNQKRLSSLENGQCLFCDLYGRVGVLQVDYIFMDIFKAFDTRPPQLQAEEEKEVG